MSGEITPRVNASYLEEFRNQPVRLVGKLTQRSDLAGIVDSSGNVQVKLNAVSIRFILKFSRYERFLTLI